MVVFLSTPSSPCSEQREDGYYDLEASEKMDCLMFVLFTLLQEVPVIGGFHGRIFGVLKPLSESPLFRQGLWVKFSRVII